MRCINLRAALCSKMNMFVCVRFGFRSAVCVMRAVTANAYNKCTSTSCKGGVCQSLATDDVERRICSLVDARCGEQRGAKVESKRLVHEMTNSQRNSRKFDRERPKREIGIEQKTVQQPLRVNTKNECF